MPAFGVGGNEHLFCCGIWDTVYGLWIRPKEPKFSYKLFWMQDIGHCTKAATDPKNWIREPAGSDLDPDPLTHETFFHQPKSTPNA